jgi:multidrug efflux pump subunit AcrA (membrane-fusion protein)
MAATLTQQRTQHEAARAKVLAELAELDAQRPALALDGTPAQLQELDSERARLQVVADRDELALQELARRDEEEAKVAAERERKTLAATLHTTLASRMKHTGAAVTLAEQLGEVLGAIVEDERLAFEIARRLGVDGSLRSVLPALQNVVVGRLQGLPTILPRIRPAQLERQDQYLATVLAMKAEPG